MPRVTGSDATTTCTPASKARIALRTDVDKLMDYFLLTESVRYQEFARVWQALNFALIYVGLKENKDKKEFIQDAFELVSEYLQPPYDLQRRVCALYTLYGLYYTQTCHPKIKIRMCLENWKETLALHDDLQEQGHLDALYIFHKMRLDKAFKFTATHAQMFYQGRAKKPEDFERWAAKHQSFMASVLDEELLQELEQVHVGYQSSKQVLPGSSDDASLVIVNDSMSDYIVERISNIDDVPREMNSETVAVANSQARSSCMQEIRKRAFSSPAQVSRARRTRMKHTDDSETDDPTFNPTSIKSKVKGRQKRKGGAALLGSDSSSASPTRRKRRASNRISSPENIAQKSEKIQQHHKKSPLKCVSDDTSGSPDEAAAIVMPKEVDLSSKKKRKKSVKKTKDMSENKRESSSNDKEDGEPTAKNKKHKSKKPSAKEQSHVEENLLSDEDKGKQSKKKQKTPSSTTKARHQRLSSSKKSPSSTKQTPNTKVEPTAGSSHQAIEVSPRKRSRKSHSPRRLIQP